MDEAFKLHLDLAVVASERAYFEPEFSIGRIPLEELIEEFSLHEVGEKTGPGFIPAKFRPCPEICNGDGANCGGNKAHRLAVNVEAMTAFVGDFDHVPDGTREIETEKLTAQNITHVWYNTHSHLKDGLHSFRIIIPFAKPLPLSCPELWSKVYWPKLSAHFGWNKHADKRCADPGRLYFGPRKPSEDSPHATGNHRGDVFDWEALLGPAALVQADVPPPEIKTEPEDPSRPVDLDNFRARLKRVKNGDAAPLIKNLIAGKALTPAPEKRKPGQMARYSAWQLVTYQMALQAEPWESSEQLMRVVEPSWHEEVLEDESDHTPAEKIRELFDKARIRAPRYKALRTQRDEMVRLALMRQRSRDSVATMNAACADSAKPEQDSGTWTDKLQSRLDKNGKPVLLQTGHNVSVILENNPQWKDALRFNELTKAPEIQGGPDLGPSYATRDSRGKPFDDSMLTAISNWFERDCNITLHPHLLERQILLAAKRQPYHPIRSRLEAIQWDRVERLDNWLITYLGAATKDPSDSDITPYVRAVGAKWLISAIARLYEPGSKVDTVLTLEGGQGHLKSTALETIAGGVDFFTDSKLDIGTKDAMQVCGRKWIVELGELETIRRSETEAQKQFLSSRVDFYRAPYERAPKDHPRHCVFAGSTNYKGEYLKDQTGNRRWWLVSLERDVDIVALRRDRDQLLAEAVVRYLAKDRWWFERGDPGADLAEQQALQRTATDPIFETLCSEWYKKPPEQRPLFWLFVDAQKILQDAGVRWNTRDLGIALRKLGMTIDRPRVRNDDKTSRGRHYYPSDEMKGAPQIASSRRALTFQPKPHPPASA